MILRKGNVYFIFVKKMGRSDGWKTSRTASDVEDANKFE